MSNKKRTTLILRLIMAPIAILSIVIFPPWDGIWAWLAPIPDTVQEQVNDAIAHGLDGIIVYVDEAGEPPAYYSAGWKDRVKNIPADPQSLFKIGSINKLYVAVATTKLIDEQRLSLDDRLTDYFPELAGRIENADTITLRLLLQHRSGIPNYTDDPDFNWADPPKNNKEALELVLDMPADFEPDEAYGYSNSNYLLIRNILDSVLGYSHHQFIKREILLPLGLTNTYSSLGEVDIDNVMSGYGAGLEHDFKNIDFGMLATAEDVGIFLRALNDGSLFNDDEQAVYSSIYEYGHKGWVLGYHSIARYHPDIDAVVIQFVNTTLGNTELTTIVVYNRIVRILRKQ